MRRHVSIEAILGVTVLAACGGGGNPVAPPPPPPPPSTPTSINLRSDPGDFIGQGKNYIYSLANARIAVTASGNHLKLSVEGDERWTGEFEVRASQTLLEQGFYGPLTRWPFHNPAVGGLSWSGEGRGCNTLIGNFSIQKALYRNSSLAEVDLQFDQFCESAQAGLHAVIHWSADDPTKPPGPVAPPGDLWQPPAGIRSLTSNYLYVESHVPDYVGQGRPATFTPADAAFTLTESNGHLKLVVAGDELWSGDLQVMSSVPQLQTGAYFALHRYPFHNPARGGISWTAGSRGCNTVDGWFVIDAVTYSGGALTAVEARFQQLCDGVIAALFGALHWRADDHTVPPGPVQPPPANLWQPAPGATPPSGNYVYLESEPGDFIGQGQTFLYTPPATQMEVTANGTRIDVMVLNTAIGESWLGIFEGMNTLSRLQLGYYPGLLRSIVHNPAKGGMDWFGNGRGCNTLTGWFVIDAITYIGNSVTAIDLRFEQHCEGRTPALHGKVHLAS